MNVQRILIVEDETDAAMALAEVLQREGFETCVAHEGTAALELFREEAPDAVLLDVRLPDTDGYQLRRELEAAADGRPVRWLALSGLDAEEHGPKARADGFDEYLLKPVPVERLVDLLRAE